MYSYNIFWEQTLIYSYICANMSILQDVIIILINIINN